MAEREGFEPSVPSRARRISSAVHSTTLPPLRRRPEALNRKEKCRIDRVEGRPLANDSILAKHPFRYFSCLPARAP